MSAALLFVGGAAAGALLLFGILAATGNLDREQPAEILATGLDVPTPEPARFVQAPETRIVTVTVTVPITVVVTVVVTVPAPAVVTPLPATPTLPQPTPPATPSPINAVAPNCQHASGVPQAGEYVDVVSIGVNRDVLPAIHLSEVVGELHNPCTVPVRVQVRGAALYDARGGVVAANTYAFQCMTIPPGQARPFAVQYIDARGPWTSTRVTLDEQLASSSSAVC